MEPDCLRWECLINEEGTELYRLLTISTGNVERESCRHDKRRVKTSRVVTAGL